MGCWCDRISTVLGRLAKLLSRSAECGFPARSSLCASNGCACFYPWINARLLVLLSLMLIPSLGCILQPRWFQGVSCHMVNPCPALSCMNLPGWLGCSGNLLCAPCKPLLEIPGCSLLGQGKVICQIVVAMLCSHIVLMACSRYCCILSGIGSKDELKKP